MNLNEISLGELKELRNLFTNSATISDSGDNLFNRYIGKFVICRSRNEGVNAGTVVALDDTGVILKDARRLFYHKPINKNVSWYEGVAKTGISSDSKVGTPVEKLIIEDYSLTVCTKEAEESIKNTKDHAQR